MKLGSFLKHVWYCNSSCLFRQNTIQYTPPPPFSVSAYCSDMILAVDRELNLCISSHPPTPLSLSPTLFFVPLPSKHNTSLFLKTHARTRAHTYVRTRAHTHTYTRTHARTHTHTHTHTHTECRRVGWRWGRDYLKQQVMTERRTRVRQNFPELREM